LKVDWLGLIKFLSVMLIIAFIVYPGDSKLGVGYRMSHQLESAEKKLLQAYAKDSTNRIVIENLIDTYDGMGKLGQRMRFLERLIVLYPSHLPFLRKVQEQFNWEQDLNGLVKSSELILKYYPNDSLSIEHSLNSYQQMGTLEKSRTLLEKLYATSPLSPQRMKYYVHVLEQLGDIERYEEIVRKRFNENTASKELFEELFNLLILQEKQVAADFLAMSRLNRNKSLKTARYLARLHEAFGFPVKAAEILLAFLKIDGSQDSLRLEVAKYYTSAEKNDLAAEQFEIMAEKKPRDKLYLELAKLYRWSENMPEEVKQYERLLARGYKPDQMYLKIIERYSWMLDFNKKNKFERLRLGTLRGRQQHNYAKIIFKGYLRERLMKDAYDLAWKFLEKNKDLEYWANEIYALSLWSGPPSEVGLNSNKIANPEQSDEESLEVVKYHVQVCEDLKPWLKKTDSLYHRVIYSQLSYYQGISDYSKSRELITHMMSESDLQAQDTVWIDERFRNSLFASKFLWAQEDLASRRKLGYPLEKSEIELAGNLFYSKHYEQSLKIYNLFYKSSLIQLTDLNNMIEAAEILGEKVKHLEYKLLRYQMLALNSSLDPGAYISAMIERDDYFTLKQFSEKMMSERKLKWGAYSMLFDYWADREDYETLIDFLSHYKKFNSIVPRPFKEKAVRLSNALAYEKLELANHLLAGVDL
jgi:hypothetical protein